MKILKKKFNINLPNKGPDPALFKAALSSNPKQMAPPNQNVFCELFVAHLNNIE